MRVCRHDYNDFTDISPVTPCRSKTPIPEVHYSEYGRIWSHWGM